MSAGKARRGLVMGQVRESGTIVLVAALSSFYAAALVMGSSLILTLAQQGSNSADDLGAIGTMLSVVSTVFIGIALYVATIVMSGCVATVIAGRVRQIALLRLLGADARALRRSVRSGCTLAGLVGAVIGVPLGVLTADIARGMLVDRGSLPAAPYPSFVPMTIVVILPVVAAAWLAGWIGSRRVLEVSPAEAFAGTAAAVPTKRASRIRGGLGVVLIVLGLGLLAGAAMQGETDPQAGFLMAFAGSIISATGVLLGASLVLPPTVKLLSGLLGRDATTQIARRNAVADPMRTTRSTLGLVIGVTLVTTFASGFAALDAAMDNWDLDFAERLEAHQILSVISTIMLCIVVISAIIAAVGFVSTMSLTVVQRTRELGLLRALGFTRGQVRMMITKESIALGVTAVIVGIVLGLFYGSMGAQALIGQENDGFVWGIPGGMLALITVASILLVLAASQPPAQRAISIAPHDALRAEA